MPPIPDRKLEERILKAAQRLWRAHGDKGLTLRAVAREAGTTTPTLYQRFRDKKALKVALSLRIRDEMNAHLFSCSRLEDVYRRFLRFAEEHPHEYELLQTAWGPYVLMPGRPRPGRSWILSQLAERFGGEAENYAQLFDAIFLACHGAGTLLVAAEEEGVRKAIRENCVRVCDKMVANVQIFRDGTGAKRSNSGE